MKATIYYARFLVATVILITGLTMPVHTLADTIAIIGTGRVAGALGPRFAGQGHRIIYGSRNPSGKKAQDLVDRTGNKASVTSQKEAVNGADMVVLAVPWSATESVVKNLGDLSGKIVIDPTNPYKRTNDGYAEHTVETSAGELIQGWLPGAHVVKAFNTLTFLTMADPAGSGGPVTIPVVGNDDAAKARVMKLIKSIGLDAIDLGPIRYAHEVEGMLIVWANARFKGNPFDYYLRPVPGNR